MMSGFTRISLRWFVVSVAAVTLAVDSACAAGGGIPNAGDLGQGIAAIVIFVLLLAVLGKYAWKPIIAQLEKREENIASQLQEAEEHKQQAEQSAAEYAKQLEQADTEAEQLILDARREAARQREAILAEARTEAKSLRRRAEEDIVMARQQAQKQLQSQTAAMASQIAAQLLKKHLTPDDHSRLLQEAHEQIVRHNQAEEVQP